MLSKLRIAITLGAIALLTANTSAVKLRSTQAAEAATEEVEATTTAISTTTVTTTEATTEATTEDEDEDVEVTIAGAEGAEVTVEVD